MKEKITRKITQEDLYIWTVKSLFCRPPDPKAYEALKESIVNERGIKNGEITSLPGMSERRFNFIKKWLTADEKEDPRGRYYDLAMNNSEEYACRKYGVTREAFDEAIDWQIEQVDRLRMLNYLN